MRKDDIVLVNSSQKENCSLVYIKQRLANCKKTLLDLLDDWHYMQSVVQPRIIFIYESIFGDVENEIQSKSRVAAELERRVELLSIKIRRGETLNKQTIEFVEKVVTREFARSKDFEVCFNSNDIDARNGFHQTTRINNGFGNQYFKARKEWEINYEAPHLYRLLVKKLHPDVAGESETFKKYWENVQDAYRNSDIDRLKLFKKTLCTEENNSFLDTHAEEESIKNQIRDLEINIETEKRKIHQLKNQEPFIFEDKLNDNVWINRRLRKLKEKIFYLDRQIHQQQRTLRTLTGRDWKSVSLNENNLSS